MEPLSQCFMGGHFRYAVAFLARVGKARVAAGMWQNGAGTEDNMREAAGGGGSDTEDVHWILSTPTLTSLPLSQWTCASEIASAGLRSYGAGDLCRGVREF